MCDVRMQVDLDVHRCLSERAVVAAVNRVRNKIVRRRVRMREMMSD